MVFRALPSQIPDDGFCKFNFLNLSTKVPERARYSGREERELTFYRHPIDNKELSVIPHAAQTAFLGNFHPCEIKIRCRDGKVRTFQNAEAAYQAGKFPSEPNLIDLFTRYTGHKASTNIRRINGRQDRNWHQHSLQWMDTVVRAKFEQNPHLRKALLNTGNLQLTERTPEAGRDRFYGTDPDGVGENRLGECLMKVRRDLRAVECSSFLTPRPLARDTSDYEQLSPSTEREKSSNQGFFSRLFSWLGDCFRELFSCFGLCSSSY